MDNEKLNAVVSYDGDGELISDISSSKPLDKINTDKKSKKVLKNNTKKKSDKKDLKNNKGKTDKKTKTKKLDIIKEKLANEIKSDKDIYTEIQLKNDNFILIYNNVKIYDSISDSKSILIFKKDGFQLNNNDYLYQGLSLKFKK